MPTGRILIVEDDDDVRDSLAEVLAQEGYDVVGAANGRKALDVLANAGPKPFVILLDLMMPVMNGWEFRKQQMADPKVAGIPIVVISADGNTHKADDLRPLTYLVKPLSVATLLETIEGAAAG